MQSIGDGIRVVYRVAVWGHLGEMPPNDAQPRHHILSFFERHGLKATLDALGSSQRTLYRGCKKLREADGTPRALAARSCLPAATHAA